MCATKFFVISAIYEKVFCHFLFSPFKIQSFSALNSKNKTETIAAFPSYPFFRASADLFFQTL